MMFGFEDGWWVVPVVLPVMLWVVFGPFVMGAMGVWCARRPGRRPRLWSVLLPLEPLGAPAFYLFRPERWDDATWSDDLLGYTAVFVLADTLVPWLLGYGITRAVRASRARRALRDGRPGPDSPDTGPGAEPTVSA
ncbi:hypothetical protein ACIGO8_32935 [Streptomyces sp. NPDC053493]|uniref:hypothetical protein n=1 Tax=Streptomyces sp. NPDC053493 TaxID=3365705 RepID=UPI0037D21D51